ncbi:unnamed protein product [Psylliodes chrysocephalus]|uniref:Endonuclease/exonuclease/phosphatase domain-containing protein n=1 Tax=Psylliodes chrysocephalus TaxID=3402493 RepID=A0A9P0G6G5_9CUCU|nr:unnamed protein product [Psylliodes chrysocephala]
MATPLVNKYKTSHLATQFINVEHLFVLLSINNETIIFGAVYIPPGLNHDACIDHCSAVEHIVENNHNNKLYLFGDHNLPHATWNYSYDDGLSDSCPAEYPAIIISESFFYLNLSQANGIPNPRLM